MRKGLTIAVAGFGLLAVLVVAIGFLLPAEHEVSRTLFLPRGAREVWHTVMDWRDLSRWRTDVRRATRLDERRGWAEIGGAAEGPWAVVRAVPPRELVLTIGDDGAVSRTWTYAFEPTADGSGCRIRLTERGRVDNPIVRFAHRVLLEDSALVTSYLNDLARRFGEEPLFVD